MSNRIISAGFVHLRIFLVALGLSGTIGLDHNLSARGDEKIPTAAEPCGGWIACSLPEMPATPAADTASPDISLVNPGFESDEPHQGWSLHTYGSQEGQRDAGNSWRYPDRIRTVPGKAELAGTNLAYRFSPLSLAVLKIQRKATAAGSKQTSN